MKTPQTKHLLAVALAAALSTGLVPANAQNYFSPGSFWNTSVRKETLSTDQSDVARLVSQVNLYGSWMNTTQYSTPVYVVPANQPTITITDINGYNDTNYWGPVPWPSNASPAAGSDKHIVIWQPTTNKMWEFWVAGGIFPNITAYHGGKMTNTSFNSGIFPSPNGATATGLPLLGGLITLAEADQIAANPNYVIPHAIALSVVQTKNFHVAPATRHDTYDTGENLAIPEGRRFRLPASFNVNTQMASAKPVTRAIARAVQEYGMVIRDRSGAVTLYGEDPKTRSVSPWTSTIFTSYLTGFPWSSLEQLDAPGTGVVTRVETYDPPTGSSGEPHTLAGSLTQFDANSAGDNVIYQITAVSPATYKIFVGVKTGPLRGNFQTAVALSGSGIWTNVGGSMSQYQEVYEYKELLIGNYIVSSTGTYKFRFTATASNGGSYRLMFDYIKIVKQ